MVAKPLVRGQSATVHTCSLTCRAACFLGTSVNTDPRLQTWVRPTSTLTESCLCDHIRLRRIPDRLAFVSGYLHHCLQVLANGRQVDQDQAQER